MPDLPAAQAADVASPPQEEAGALADLLELLRDRHGLDFRGYRRTTIARRVRSRMISVGAPTLAAYVDRVLRDPAEPSRLVERLTIKVSRFFRNAGAVAEVRRALEERLARSPGRLEAWSAGCGRGEEPYTLAILLAELGQAAHDEPEVVATDIDAAALVEAERGRYGAAALTEVPAALVARHFVEEPTRWGPAYRIARGARRRVAFARHDLARAEGAPGARRFDLVCCRNTLIYFDTALQRRVQRLLRDAVAPGGFLWLGDSEWPVGELAAELETVDRKARLFRTVPGRRADA